MTASRALVLSGLVTLLAAGCLAAPVTEQGRAIAELYRVFAAGAVVVALAVWLPATYAIVRYRRRRTTDDAATGDLPRQVRGDLRLELLWTAFPALTVLALFVLTMLTLAPVQALREGGVELRVTAFRWGWEFQYPQSGVRVAGVLGQSPEVQLPVGEPVRITLTSSDVVHSFYVPAFLYKQDANPGREARFDIVIAEPGVYGGQCAEFCGTFHARMPFTIRAVDRASYDTWLASQPRTSR